MLPISNELATIVLLAEAGGGVARHVIDLYSGLRARGWPVTLIVSPIRMESMYREEARAIPHSDLRYLEMPRNPTVRDLKVIWQLRTMIRGHRSRVILHAHSTKAGMFGAALRGAVESTIFTPHAYRSIDPSLSPVRRAAIRAVEKIYSRTYDRVIAVSREEMAYAKTLKIEDARLRYIPNGLSVEKYLDARLRKRRELRVVVFVGRLVAQKDPLLFITTFARLKTKHRTLKAVIAGDGPLRSMLHDEARKLGVAHDIKWLGTYPAVEAFKQFDVMIHTSAYEGLPYSLIEAAAARLPIVATKNHGSSEVLEGVDPERLASTTDPAELAHLVTELFASDAAFDKHIACLDLIAEKYGIHHMIRSVEIEYAELLARKELVRSPVPYAFD
jgi:glycosyltransferase involved in cell wall biosynthesis